MPNLTMTWCSDCGVHRTRSPDGRCSRCRRKPLQPDQLEELSRYRREHQQRLVHYAQQADRNLPLFEDCHDHHDQQSPT